LGRGTRRRELLIMQGVFMQKELPMRKNIRLKDYDYSQAGYYFVTICTRFKENVFGTIENDEMIYSNYGMIAVNNLITIPLHVLNVRTDKYMGVLIK